MRKARMRQSLCEKLAQARIRREPVHLVGAVADWPALAKWTPEHLGRVAGERAVKVVVGNRESQAPVFKNMALREFLSACFSEHPEEQRAYYLKEYDLLAEIPELASDLQLGDLAFPNTESWHYAWIGQSGGRTGFHYDIFNNILTQIVGRKELVVIPPESTAGMYPSAKFDTYARLSLVDGFNPDFLRFPRYRDALQSASTYTLLPGDALYIPRGFWHQAQSFTATISLSGFMANRWEKLTVQWPEAIRIALHRLGLYKRGLCTCHSAES